MDFGKVVVRDTHHHCGVIHPDRGRDIGINPSEYYTSGLSAAERRLRVCYHVTEGRDGSAHADHIVDTDVVAGHDRHGRSTYQQIRDYGAKLIY